ncbi:PleD family two-component system response regulator [Maritimibacter sp. DP1N21-5]|uniref:response regulator n=1 Tax=Maritimibacter sp. DP1N21-5 TaxID=2836867 RepID=UPI001C486BE5|nr:response regulator transcription factor [Maritimibacter sp. DP1N21-5]MBV7407491.1 response regulator transcription factor [Maritimibacter sp. DP1N21-5]
MRMLVVDDDTVMLALLQEIIKATTNYEVMTASSAEDALAIVDDSDDEPFDCFMLDIQMPGMNGVELCRALRKSGKFPFTPIVMLTAMHEKRDVDLAFSAGATDYITKPFEIHEIKTRLDHAQRRVAQLKAARGADDSVQAVPNYGLFDNVPIFDVDDVVDYAALENYLPSLPKESRNASVVLGVQIRSIESLHSEATGLQFSGLIEDTAEALSDALRDYSCLIAYAGNGTFVVVFDGHVPNRGLLADQVNLALQKQGTHLTMNRDAQIRVICGEFIRLAHGEPGDIRNYMKEAQDSALWNATEVERNLEKFWFMGQVAH